MKKILGFLVLGLALFCLNFAGINAKEVTMQGADLFDGEEKVKKVLLNELRDAEMTKLILGNQVQLLYYDDYYETDPSLYQRYQSILAGCPKLETIEVQNGNPSLKAESGVLYSKNGEYLYAVPMKKGGKLVIPEGTKQIGRCAINGCSKLTSITIPSTLRWVCEAGLGNNKGVKQYKINGKSRYFTVKDGVLFTKDMKTLVSYPAGKKNRTYRVPNGVKTIHSAAFMGNSYIEEIRLPDSVQTIENEAFEKCTKLRSFKSGKKLRHINAGAFYKCKKLAKVSLNNGLISIEDYCFTGVKAMKKIYLPESLSSTYGLGSLPRRIEVTAYRRSAAWSYFRYNKNVKLITKKHAQQKRKVVAVKGAVKGTGRPNTKWYKKGKKKFTIKSADELAGLAKLVDKGKDFEGCTIALTKNIDLVKYKNFPQIGGYHKVKGKSKTCAFKGSFDGKKHTISNLTMKNDNSNSGLFYKLAANAYIRNVLIKGADIDGSQFTGAIAGVSDGIIEHCKVYGKIKGTECVGAIVGINNRGGKLEDCSSHATVTGTENVGGVVGESWADVINCRNHNRVTGTESVGGIAGRCTGSMTRCKNNGNVRGYENMSGIKGLKGFGEVTDCINNGKIQIKS